MAYNANNDPYAFIKGRAEDPARYVADITPSDSIDLVTYAKALKIGTAGTIKFIPVGNYANGDSSGITLTVVAGELLPIQAARVFATGTTATGIVAIYG